MRGSASLQDLGGVSDGDIALLSQEGSVKARQARTRGVVPIAQCFGFGTTPRGIG